MSFSNRTSTSTHTERTLRAAFYRSGFGVRAGRKRPIETDFYAGQWGIIDTRTAAQWIAVPTTSGFAFFLVDSGKERHCHAEETVAKMGSWWYRFAQQSSQNYLQEAPQC